MSRKPKKGYFVRGQFVAEGSELDLQYKAELKGTTGATKTDLKREMDALQKLGAELLTLRTDLFARLDLPEKLQDALAEARRITNFEGKRRQMQFVGKLMRKLDDDTVAALLEAVDARDLPGMADVDSSLLLFCREIRKTATVALSGECADEIFGGYPWYRDKTVRERYGFPWAQSTAYRVSFFKPEVFGGIDPAAYIDEGYRATLEQTSIRPGLDPLEQRMRQMFALNFNWFMQTLLDRKDRMSMYSGLEVRVPFCDYRIAEYLYSVPWEYKDYEGHEKGLLRQAMQGVLPTEVLWRKKSPYPKTWNPAYLNAVSAMLRSAMQDPDAPLLRIAKRAALEQLLTAAETATPWYGQLMTTPQTIAWFVQLNYWLQKYRVELV